MRRYAKLSAGAIVYALNPILHDGKWYGNPPADVLEEEGYKPVVYTDPPTEPGEGYQWVETWSETESEIVQGWVLVEVPDEIDAEEALEILLGGDGG